MRANRGLATGAAIRLCIAVLSFTASTAWADSAAAGSDAALAALKALGAQVQHRPEPTGPGRIVIAMDNSWRGGDDGLAHLKDVEGLYKLRLGGHISDDGLKHLEALPHLKSLDVHVLGITDAGVAHLKSLTDLERLNLTYTKVTDAGLRHLTGMSRLKWLGLNYTQVTQAGVSELQRSLENTLVEGHFSR